MQSPNLNTVALPEAQWRILLQFLTELREQFSAAASNDYPISGANLEQSDALHLLHSIQRLKGRNAGPQDLAIPHLSDIELADLLRHNITTQTGLTPLPR